MLTNLKAQDPELYEIIKDEEKREKEGINLIASENFTSLAVRECLGSVLTNKYSEGVPGDRFYCGTENVDKIELLCQQRALTAFNLSQDDWHVNVQVYSGSPANFAVYTAFLNPHDRIMGLALPAGGHLTHGFYVSASSKYFESLPYGVNEETGLVDFDKLLMLAKNFRPKLIICGASAYARIIEFEQFRKIADTVDALLMADMSHISGLVAASVHPSPFPFCDIVTTTTHKTLRGPRSALIFVNRKTLSSKLLDSAVFPGLQGGPHNHQIAAVACQLKEVMTPEFKQYAQQIVLNTRALADYLIKLGYKLVTNGTDNHLILWDLRLLNIKGVIAATACEYIQIYVNKNSVPGDEGTSWSGIRLGTAAITTLGYREKEMEIIAHILHEIIQITIKLSGVWCRVSRMFSANVKILKKEFKSLLDGREDVAKLRKKVNVLSIKFESPVKLDTI